MELHQRRIFKESKEGESMSMGQTKNGIPMIGTRNPNPKYERKPLKVVKKNDKPITERVKVEKPSVVSVPKKVEPKVEFVPTFLDKKEDVILEIRARKDFKSLFSPLQFPEIKNFQKTLARVCSDYNPEKLTKNVVHQLKLMAYFKELKGKDRKYLPSDSDKIKIIQLAIIEDLIETTEYDFYDILNMLKNSTKNEYFLKTLFGLEDIRLTMDNYSLITQISNFDHYDIVIKYHRTLNKPVIANVIVQILKEIDNTRLPKLNNSEYDKIMMVFNLIGKMGLSYCNSRSNLEWAIYNKTLRKLRNFFSKNTYGSFSKTVCDSLQYCIKQDMFEKTLYGFDKIVLPFIEKEKTKKLASFPSTSAGKKTK